MEKGKLSQLSALDKVAIRFHLTICKFCREYKRDSHIMDKAIKKALSRDNNVSFSPAEKEEMILQLKSK